MLSNLRRSSNVISLSRSGYSPFPADKITLLLLCRSDHPIYLTHSSTHQHITRKMSEKNILPPIYIYITGMIISYIFLFKISQVVYANITNAVVAVNIIFYHHCRTQIIGGSYMKEADLKHQEDCQYGDKNSPPAHFQLATLGGCGDNLNSRVPET